MNWFVTAFFSGVVAFVFSNLDDLLLLTVWFSQTTEVNQRLKKKEEEAAAEQHRKQVAAADVQPTTDEEIKDDDDDDLPPELNQVNKSSFSNWHVIFGQYLGFFILIIISMVGFLAGSLLPGPYIGLLGFVPLLIGLYKLYELIQARCCPSDDQPEVKNTDQPAATESIDPQDAAAPQPSASPTQQVSEIHSQSPSPSPSPDTTDMDSQPEQQQQSLDSPEVSCVRFHMEEDALEMTPQLSNYPPSHTSPTIQHITVNVTPDPPAGTTEVEPDASSCPPCLSFLLPLFASSDTLKVAAVTIANGADNLGIYIPLFAASNPAQITVILVVFLLFVAIWLGFAYSLMYFPPISAFVRKYGEYVVPIALMALGIYIFYDSDTLSITQ